MDTALSEAPGLVVSFLPDPTARPDWHIIEAMLRPALSDGELFDEAIDICWVAFCGRELLGAATTRLRTDGAAELRLVGGHEFRRWVGPMEQVICDWARAAGASRLMARGRMGWRRAMLAGWAALSTDDENKTHFEKVL